VREEIIDLKTRAGAMETFVVRPERGGPYPPVLFLMDAPGIREELYDMARRLATVGYYVLLPNLYYRAGRDTKYRQPDVLEHGSPEHTRMRSVRTRMTIPPVMDDVADMIAFLDGQAEAKDGPVGVHGYCMSGPYALAAAARYPDRIAAAASFYGTWLVNDAEESPHLTLAKGRAELYISCAEHDDLAPPEMVRELQRLWDAAKPEGELEIHPGVHHGFAFPERKVYDKPAAERHWERLIALYRRRLG
jgi:carboxymethylenebutenolidase